MKKSFSNLISFITSSLFFKVFIAWVLAVILIEVNYLLTAIVFLILFFREMDYHDE